MVRRAPWFNLAMLGILLINLAVVLTYVRWDAFDHDELQHTHIAWSMAHGKIIYRDFFDHHGPLYAAVNTVYLKLCRVPAAFSTLFKLRGLNTVFLMGILGLTCGIGRRLFHSWRVGLCAAALASSLVMLQNKGVEVRPDTLQNFFWLAGFFVLAGDPDQPGKRACFLSGLFWGLAALSNAKAGLGIVFAFAALVMLSRHWVWNLLAMMLVALLACGVFWLYGALNPFLFFNLAFNILYFSDVQPWTFKHQISILLTQQTALIVWAITGIAILYHRRSPKNPAALNIMVCGTMAAACGIVLGFFSQYYLTFLPQLAVLAAAAMCTLISQWPKAAGVAVVLSLLSLEYSAVHSAPWVESAHLRYQRNLTTLILAKTPRSEAVGFIWNNCGGYMFNESVSYYWNSPERNAQAYERVEGFNVFGERYIAALRDQDVHYVIAYPGELDRLPPETSNYIRQHFTNVDCLWTRGTRGPSAGD